MPQPTPFFDRRDAPGHVAVIGAGLAGLTCARRLAERGLSVTVFEKSRGAGGRMATRRTPAGDQFDHGCQYFTAQDERFLQHVESWQKEGLVARWPARIGELEGGRFELGAPQLRYVAVPGMDAIGKHLAAGLDVRWETGVRPPQPENGRWQLESEVGLALGGWKCVVISAPAPQAAELLTATPGLAAAARSVDLTGCWAVMLSFDRPLNLDFDAAFVYRSPLSWIARNGSKPGRSGTAETWVLHATSTWSEARIEDHPDNVLPDLLAALWEATGRLPREPRCALAHRWRYALPLEPLGIPSLFDSRLRIGVCGDWCAEPRVEGAFLSGAALAERILAAEGAA